MVSPVELMTIPTEIELAQLVGALRERNGLSRSEFALARRAVAAASRCRELDAQRQKLVEFFREHADRIVFTERANELGRLLEGLNVGYRRRDTMR